MSTIQEKDERHWFVMRDLKRSNAKLPAYKMLAEAGIEVFTPMKWRLSVRNGRKLKESIPFIQDLLFVHDSRDHLDRFVNATSTLQYRFLRNAFCRPMTVRDEDMNRFITAVRSAEDVRYYMLEEITPEMRGRSVRIIDGPLAGYEGRLLSVRGSRVRRLLVELPDLLTAGIEVSPEFIQLL